MSQELDIVARLRRIEDLLTALVKSKLTSVIEQELSDPKMKKLYELTGECTVRELSKETGFSIATISRVWQRWENLGLIVKEGKKYRKLLNKN